MQSRIRSRRGAGPRGRRRRWPRAAPSSATTRSGRTTTPARNGLETLAEFAAAAPEHRPRRRRDRPRPPPARRDRRRIERARARPRALWLGVGAGFSREAADRDARGAAASCARRCPASASCSPRWGRRCARSAGAEFDGVFFNWMTPEFAAGARAGRARRRGGRPRSPAGLRLRPHRRRPRRRRAPRQGGVLLPRPPRRLPQPLRPPRRARGHRRRRRRRPRRGPGERSPPTRPSTRSSSAAWPAPTSRR